MTEESLLEAEYSNIFRRLLRVLDDAEGGWGSFEGFGAGLKLG